VNSTPIEKAQVFLQEVEEFRKIRVSRLRNINHWWNITLTVTGITLTAVTTIMGVINDDKYKDWIKVGIAFSGSVAVLSQSANKEFRVKGKAGKYAQIEADLLILESKIKKIANDEELSKLYADFYAAIELVGDIEYESEQNRA
jgi:hypothetical protein